MKKKSNSRYNTTKLASFDEVAFNIPLNKKKEATTEDKQ